MVTAIEPGDRNINCQRHWRSGVPHDYEKAEHSHTWTADYRNRLVLKKVGFKVTQDITVYY